MGGNRWSKICFKVPLVPCLWVPAMQNLKPALRQKTGRVFLYFLLLDGLQLNTIFVSKRHNLGWHILVSIITTRDSLCREKLNEFKPPSEMQKSSSFIWPWWKQMVRGGVWSPAINLSCVSGSKSLCFLQASKLACYYLRNAIRKHETLGSETKDYFINDIESHMVSLTFRSRGTWQVAQVEAVHAVNLHHNRGTQMWCPEGDVASSLKVAHCEPNPEKWPR